MCPVGLLIIFLYDWFGSLFLMFGNKCVYIYKKIFLKRKIFEHPTNATATYFCDNHVLKKKMINMQKER